MSGKGRTSFIVDDKIIFPKLRFLELSIVITRVHESQNNDFIYNNILTYLLVHKLENFLTF